MNDSSRIVEGFIDANVLADAILADNRIEELSKEAVAHEDSNRFSQELKDLFNSYQPAKFANILFVILQSMPRSVLMTANLAFLEARGVIAELYKKRQLSRRGIPAGEWQSKKMKLKNEELLEIYAGVSKFRMKYDHHIVISDEYDIHTAETLVVEYSCSARDAILVSGAIQASCNRFVTRDTQLKRLLRGYKKIRIVELEVFLKELGYAGDFVPHQKV
ncbi:MAG: hypothetical protein ABSD41_04900 [Candidatus Bathyarchaeia archaeon]